MPNNSPIETLAAFAIAFAAGVASTVALSAYTRFIQQKASRSAQKASTLG